MKNGVLAGYPLDSLKVTFGRRFFPPVTQATVIRNCAIKLQECLAKAGPGIDGAYHETGSCYSGKKNMGDVIGDLNKRRGQVEGMESSRSGCPHRESNGSAGRNVWLRNCVAYHHFGSCNLFNGILVPCTGFQLYRVQGVLEK